MPSASLGEWNGPRTAALDEVDTQCAVSIALLVPNPTLVEENLRAYVLLVSAHFQRFCRGLFTECSQFVAMNVGSRIEPLDQPLLTNKMALDHGNPNLANSNSDFNRFGFILDLPGAHPSNPTRIENLADLNKWRNAAAHHGNPPTKGKPPTIIPLTLRSIRNWRNSCSGLAVSLDGIMYNHLRLLIRSPRPWVP